MPIETETPRHPSWVTVQFNRIQGDRTFFGSSVRSSSWVRLTVSEARRFNQFGHDRIQGGLNKELVTVDLSPAQFAELLTAMNVGSGVPGTMVRYDGRNVEKYEETSTETTQVKEYFEEQMKKNAQRYQEAKDEIEKIFKEKATLNKSDRQQVLDLLDKVVIDVGSNMPFYVNQFHESAEKITTQAKAEVDSFISQAVINTGLEALRSGVAPLIGSSSSK